MTVTITAGEKTTRAINPKLIPFHIQNEYVTDEVRIDWPNGRIVILGPTQNCDACNRHTDATSGQKLFPASSRLLNKDSDWARRVCADCLFWAHVHEGVVALESVPRPIRELLESGFAPAVLARL